MKMQELKLKTPSELKDILLKSKREHMSFRFQKVNAQLTSPAEMRKVRRTIARIKTMMHAAEQKKS